MANVSGAVAPQTKAGSVKEVTTASFRADVLTASTRQPVLVDFWAPWCGPCKQLAPALEKAVADSGGKVTLVKMNIDEHPQIAGQLGIQSIPAVIAFDKGQPVDGFVGALLLPRRPIQLTVFEPRYLEMLDNALSGERLIGIIQPTDPEETADPSPELYPLGCAGRIVQYAEIGDGRCFLTLMGVARFHLKGETPTGLPYRIAAADYSAFAEDFLEGAGEAAVDREDLIAALKRFAEVNEIKVVWSDIKKTSNEALVNGLSMMSPCGPKEKQALLEAKDLKSRAEMLVAITTIELARGQDAATQIH